MCRHAKKILFKLILRSNWKTGSSPPQISFRKNVITLKSLYLPVDSNNFLKMWSKFNESPRNHHKEIKKNLNWSQTSWSLRARRLLMTGQTASIQTACHFLNKFVSGKVKYHFLCKLTNQAILHYEFQIV